MTERAAANTGDRLVPPSARGPGEDPRAVLAREVAARAQAPSLVAATFRAGVVDWRIGIGDVGGQYRIGSITKTLTAVLVLQLRDEGRVALDDPLGRHLPDAPYADATLRMLLAHSSGLTAEPTGPWWERVPGGSWADLVRANTPVSRIWPAGVRHHYTNLGYALLGRLVAEHRGDAWFDVVADRLLSPLEMRSTTYDPLSDAAPGTSRDPRSGVLVREPSEDSGAMAPAGQLWSTLDDLARWGDVLVAGSDGVLAPETALEMGTVQAGDPETQHRGGYGVGLRLHWAGDRTLVGHTGSMPGFLAALLTDPVDRVGAVVLANVTTGLDPEDCAARLHAAALAAASGVADPTPAPSEPVDGVPPGTRELAGDWYWGNTAMHLRPTSDGFVLVDGRAERRFTAAGADAFVGLNGYFAGERLAVHRRADGSVSHLEVVSFVLTRTPYDPQAPIPGGPPAPL